MAMEIRGKPDELDRVARVIGEERGQCAFLICLLMPMVGRTFVRLILTAPTRHLGVLRYPNGFRLQPFFFVEGTGTDADVLLQSPHPSPCRQYVIWLDAEYELTASDGEKRVIGVGEVVLAEDTTGKGHITKPLGQKLAHGLFIPID
jgi:hypothetical protein